MDLLSLVEQDMISYGLALASFFLLIAGAERLYKVVRPKNGGGSLSSYDIVQGLKQQRDSRPIP